MKKWLKILKDVAVVVGGITSAWLLFEAYDQFKDGQDQQLENDQVFMEQMKCVKVTVDSINQNVDANTEAIMANQKALVNLDRRFQFYMDHVDEMTKEQMQDVWNLGYDAGKKKELMIP